MNVIVTVLLLSGVVLLLAGYVRNHRNVLLLAGILLLGAAVLPDFAAGFMAGARSGAGAVGARP